MIAETEVQEPTLPNPKAVKPLEAEAGSQGDKKSTSPNSISPNSISPNPTGVEPPEADQPGSSELGELRTQNVPQDSSSVPTPLNLSCPSQ